MIIYIYIDDREREREICILYILHGALRSFSQFAATAHSPSWRHSESMRALLPTFNCAQGTPWRIVARNMQPNEHARSRTVILPVSWTMLRLIWQPIRVCVRLVQNIRKQDLQYNWHCETTILSCHSSGSIILMASLLAHIGIMMLLPNSWESKLHRSCWTGW